MGFTRDDFVTAVQVYVDRNVSGADRMHPFAVARAAFGAGFTAACEAGIEEIRERSKHGGQDHCPTRTIKPRNKLDCNCSDRSLGIEKFIRALGSIAAAAP